MRINLLEALSDNIKIDKDKCTFCGTCVETCILDNLRMKLAPCRQGCPLGVNCQGYVQLILRDQEEEALAMVERNLPFPRILGYLCSAQCENSCHRKQSTGQAVAIKALKHYLVQSGVREQWSPPDKAAPSGKKIAVAGTGPAGMLAAYDLLVQGHEVTMLDAQEEPGGMLRWAIPEFRLPQAELEAEIKKLELLGSKFSGGVTLGQDVSVQELSRNYDAAIIALGCSQTLTLGISGEDASNVLYALNLLKDIRAGHAPRLGQEVVVLGGGATALDAARSALRLGAQNVTMAFLEEQQDMPVDSELLAIACAEGVKLEPSWGPTRIFTKDGQAAGVELKRCLSVFDDNGQFAPCFDEQTLHRLDADSVIIAIGQVTDNVAYEQWGQPACHSVSLQTKLENVFMAGDGLNGPSTVVEAMASGREAAISAHRFVSGEHLLYGRNYAGAVEKVFEISLERGSDEARVSPGWRNFKGQGDFAPVQPVLSKQEAQREASRCYSCGQPFGKYRTCWFCLPCEVECPHDALWVEIPYLLR